MRKTIYVFSYVVAAFLCLSISASCAKNAPIAGFIAEPTSGEAPLEVQFTDQSTGEATSYSWDFNNDGTADSTVQNPTYTYDTKGSYTVSLTITGPGGSDTETITDYIEVKEGELPSRTVGDQWVYTVISDATEYTFTMVVTGEEVVEGIDCWTENYLFEPAMDGMGTMSVWSVKDTVFPLKMESSGVYDGHPYTAVTTYSYEFLEGFSWWPLEVGKEGTVQETQTTTVTSGGEVVSTETNTVTVVLEIEKKEDIEVLAGTFNCFKILEKGEDGTVHRVYWYSDCCQSAKWDTF